MDQFCMNVYFSYLNSLGPRQNGRHFADDNFRCIFVNENVWIPIKISLKFIPKGAINNIPALVKIMAWCRAGYKPLSEPMMVSLPTHICITRPQWVNPLIPGRCEYICDFKYVLFKHVLLIDIFRVSYENFPHTNATGPYWWDSLWIRLWLGNKEVPSNYLNYANPVYGVNTICHQVHWLCWGHPSLFHTVTSLLIWYEIFYIRDISYRLIWMKFINMLSVYAQSGMHRCFN